MAMNRTGHFCAPMRRSWLLGVVLVLAGAPFALADDLTTAQQALLTDAEYQLSRAETGLKFAQETAGRGDAKPTGSRLKLALVRLNSAKQPMPTAADRLAKLPADHPAVQVVQQRYDTVQQAIDQLETRLTGSAPAAAAQADTGVKLDYRQEEALKNAKFTLRDLNGRVQALAQLVEQSKSVSDQTMLDHRVIARSIEAIADARRRAGFVQNHLEDLPADGAGVRPVVDELATAVQTIDASEQFLLPIHQRLTELLNPAGYPDLPADTARLKELSSMFRYTQALVQLREQAAEIFQQGPAASAEHDRVVQKYALLIRQKTNEGALLDNASIGFRSSYTDFMAAAEAQKASLPAEISGHLAEARELGRQAVEEQKPLFFTGGVEQNMGFVEEKLALLKVLDPQGAKASEAQLADTRAELKKAQDALRESIIQANSMPANNYANADRADIEDRARKAWLERDAQAEILAVRIPGAEWKREVMWRYSNGTWYKIDRSRLQAQVLARHDGRLAVIQPINIWKNHLSNDTVTAFPFWAEGDELPPSSYLLLEKIK